MTPLTVPALDVGPGRTIRSGSLVVRVDRVQPFHDYGHRERIAFHGRTPDDTIATVYADRTGDVEVTW
jgi:hypothetical protein